MTDLFVPGLSVAALERETREYQYRVAAKIGKSGRPISGATLRQYERTLLKLEREVVRRRNAAIPDGNRKVVRVAGTTFRFPALPPEDSDAVRQMQAYQDAVIKTAQAVKPKAVIPWQPSNTRPPKPGTGEFTPVDGASGSQVRLDDGRVAEVWCMAPGSGRWGLLGDGTMVRLTGRRYVYATELTAEQQRETVVAGVAKVRAGYIATQQVPDDGSPWRSAARTEWSRAREAAKQWAVELIRHELYPATWPAPAPFVDPRSTAAERRPA